MAYGYNASRGQLGNNWVIMIAASKPKNKWQHYANLVLAAAELIYLIDSHCWDLFLGSLSCATEFMI